MTKKEVEQCLKLPIFSLNRDGLLDNPGFRRGSFNWGDKYSVSYKLWLEEKTGTLKLYYTTTNGWTGEEKHIEQHINLTATKCNFGGYRYWFKCPSCNKRVGCLYADTRFLCRDCNNLIYRSSLDSNTRFSYFAKMYDYEEKAEKIYKGVRNQKFYNSKPTRRFKRYIKYREKTALGAGRAIRKLEVSNMDEALNKALKM